MKPFDAVIIGGGPVGAAAALELQAAGFNLRLLEAREEASSLDDLRPLALSYGSRLILERLGVWDQLTPATAIERIHVSQLGRFGRMLITAAEARLPALGYVVDYAGLAAALKRAIATAGVPSTYSARVTSIAHDKATARVEFESAAGTEDCLASVVVVADGNANAMGIDNRVFDYGQSALTARVQTDHPHQNVAYERFTPEGPLALLPFADRHALVWTTAPAHAEALCAAASEEFLTELQARFGERLGRFTEVTHRAAHRVSLRIAERTIIGRAVLIGNAAQALHPVAGQGFNLGLRDAWELALEMRRRGTDDPGLLEAYRARRRIDRGGGIGFTHALVKTFSNDWLPLAIARGTGLTLLDCLPFAKDFVVRRMIFGARG